MSTTLERLLVLQDRDRRILRLQRESQDVPARKAHIQSSIAKQQEELKAAQEELKKQQAAQNQLELEVETRQTKVARLREQQFEVKNNEDYRTLESEINALQTEIRELEDKELAMMEEMEQARNVIAEKRGALERGEAEVQEDLKALDQRMEKIESEVHDLQRDREELATDIDDEWLARYERILRHTGDYALVPVEDDTCSGCHMKLPPQVTQDAKKALNMVMCPFCSRLLYWRP